MSRTLLPNRTALVTLVLVCAVSGTAGVVGSPRVAIAALATYAAVWLPAGRRAAIVALLLTAALLTAVTATPTQRFHSVHSSPAEVVE